MIKFLLKTRSIYTLVGLSLFLIVICLCFIWPNNFSWMGYRNILSSGDTAQHVSGWYAFVNRPWGLPLLKATLLDYPGGANISLTDSIPLFAIIFKIFRSFLPLYFNYFSIFFIFCYFAQGLAATVLALSLRLKNNLAISAFTLFALSAPILNNAIGNEDSLACQAFILFALAVYFFNYDKRLSFLQLHIYFALIVGLSLLVHPYLAAMCYPFYIGALLESKKNQLPLKRILKYCLGLHVFILLELILFGLGTGTQGVDGFGLLAMNLLSPIYGGILQHYQMVPIRSDQADVFCYLGGGLIIGLIIALILTKGAFRKIFSEYRVLFIIGLLFFIYSIYGAIYLGTFKIAQFGVPHFFITYSFRTQGRFFWPCSYILLCFVLVTFLRKIPRTACILLPLLIIIQFVDISGYLKAVKESLEGNMQPMTQNAQAISDLISQSKIVIMYPRMACPGSGGDNLIAQTQLLSAQANVPINTAYTAHFESGVDCQDQSEQFKNFRPALLVSPMSAPSPTISYLLKNKPSRCQLIDQAYYCEES